MPGARSRDIINNGGKPVLRLKRPTIGFRPNSSPAHRTSGLQGQRSNTGCHDNAGMVHVTEQGTYRTMRLNAGRFGKDHSRMGIQERGYSDSGSTMQRFWKGSSNTPSGPSRNSGSLVRAKSAPSKMVYLNTDGKPSRVGRLSRPVTSELKQTNRQASSATEKRQLTPGKVKSRNISPRNGTSPRNEEMKRISFRPGLTVGNAWCHEEEPAMKALSLNGSSIREQGNSDEVSGVHDVTSGDGAKAEYQSLDTQVDRNLFNNKTSSLDHLKTLRRISSRQSRRKKVVSETEEQTTTDVSRCSELSKRQMSGHFYKIVRMVQLGIRLMSAMIKLSEEMTSRSATEEQWHTLNTSREVKQMAFNKTAFARDKAVSHLPSWAVRILGKLPDERTEHELRRLHALLRGLKSFDKFTEKIQFSMCRSFTFQRVESGRLILRQGHVGINFYFLFTGSVFVNLNDTDVYGHQFVKTEVVLKRGDSFGELALLQDIRRTATISCREDCELLVVDKYTFAKVCPRIFEKELEEKINFLGALEIFNPKLWSKDLLKKMCFEAQIQEYKTNKVIVSDSTSEPWIYVCMEGKCQVLRRLDLDEEIAFRRRQQEILKSGQYRSQVENVINIVGHVNARNYGTDDDEAKSDATNLEVGRERMLSSMCLEYTDTRRLSVEGLQLFIEYQRRHSKMVRKDSKKLKPNASGTYEPLTLTSLLAQEEKTGDSKGNTLYLNIKTVVPKEVFDLYSLVNPTEQLTNGSYLLVSTGARILRIKRSSFFNQASQDALQLVRTIAERERYPSDDTLLNRYRDYLCWQLYKGSVVHQAIAPTLLHSNRESNLVKIMRPSVEKKTSKHRSVLSELQKVIDNERRLTEKAPQWRIDEQLLSHFQRQEQSIVTSPDVTTALPVFNDSYMSRRSSVATGLLLRENSQLMSEQDRRRHSQPQSRKEFTTIYEMDEM